MHIAIVGAGFAGLSSAKILKSFGHNVTIFEKKPDVGGVWSASRRYPGLTTQNPCATYALSDFPYPKDYPEWPSGEQIQRYLASYTQHFALEEHLELNTEVTSATSNDDSSGWTLQIHNHADDSSLTQSFDYLLVCNGIFSTPMIPDYPGKAEYEAGGGRLCHTSQLNRLEDTEDKDMLIVGYGKSSCDVAQAIADTSSSTTLVARSLIWKVPKKLMNLLNFKHLLLTRLGEGLFKYIRVEGFERFLHGVGKPIRNAMLSQVQWVTTRQCKLNELELHPGKPFETIARSTVSLVTDGFFESVAAEKIQVKRDASIEQLGVENGKLLAWLDTGDKIPADIVVCGTGWNQEVPFLSANLQQHFRDGSGNFRLYRSMIPVGVPNLAFNGYNSSFFSQLNCEIGALWLADLMGGQLTLPSVPMQNQLIDERLAWMEERTDGKHAKGTNIIPFSIHHIDELLNDMGLPLPMMVRFKQWLMPINPGDFARATQQLLLRYPRKTL